MCRDRCSRENFSQNVDAFKGLFVSLVVLGHNTLVSSAAPLLWKWLYTFHVFGFLLLPFLYPLKRPGLKDIADKALRYFVPYAIFFSVSAFAYFVLFRRNSGVFPWLEDSVIALLVGSARTLDAASGFQLFWFLPALYSIFIIRSASACLAKQAGLFLILVACVLHPIVGGLSEDVKKYTPLGIIIAVYMAPVGFLVSVIWGGVKNVKRVGVLSLFFFLISSLFLALYGEVVNIGYLTLYGYDSLFMVFVQDAVAVSAFFAGIGLSGFYGRSKTLQILGRYSLFVYLSHSLIYQAIFVFASKVQIVPSGVVERLAFGVMVFLLTLWVSILLAKVGSGKKVLWRVLFPKSLSDWGFSR